MARLPYRCSASTELMKALDCFEEIPPGLAVEHGLPGHFTPCHVLTFRSGGEADQLSRPLCVFAAKSQARLLSRR